MSWLNEGPCPTEGSPGGEATARPAHSSAAARPSSGAVRARAATVLPMPHPSAQLDPIEPAGNGLARQRGRCSYEERGGPMPQCTLGRPHLPLRGHGRPLAPAHRHCLGALGGSAAAWLKRNDTGRGAPPGARDRRPHEAVRPPPGLPGQVQAGSDLSCICGPAPLALPARAHGAGFPLGHLASPPSGAAEGRAPRLRKGPELDGEGGRVGCAARPRGGVPSARGSGWPCGPRACTPHGAAAASALLRGPSGPASTTPPFPCPGAASWREDGPTHAGTGATRRHAPLPSLFARPLRRRAWLAKCAHRRWQQEKHTNTLSAPIKAKGRPCRSTLLEGAPCGSAHIAAGQRQLHGRHEAREGHCGERGISWPHVRGRPSISAWLERRPARAQAHAHQHRSTCCIDQKICQARAVQSQ